MTEPRLSRPTSPTSPTRPTNPTSPTPDALPALPRVLAGASAAVREARTRAVALAPLAAPVLVTGERGTGRRSVAAWLHAAGPAARLPWLAPTPEKLAGALARLVAGTVYLADVDALEPALQARCLAALRRAAPGVRIVTSTGPRVAALPGASPLAELLSHWGRLRIPLPTLRARPRDVAQLAPSLLEEIGAALGRRDVRLARGTTTALMRHDWPGNWPELAATLERAVAYASDGVVTLARLRAALPPSPAPVERIREERRRAERQHLLALYRKHGTYAGMARELGITRNAAKYRLAKHDLLGTEGVVDRR